MSKTNVAGFNFANTLDKERDARIKQCIQLGDSREFAEETEQQRDKVAAHIRTMGSALSMEEANLLWAKFNTELKQRRKRAAKQLQPALKNQSKQERLKIAQGEVRAAWAEYRQTTNAAMDKAVAKVAAIWAAYGKDTHTS